ncbi:MAG TPA: DUF4442 domain-containing protein [Polyangiaceae bacterium]|nr:DUF4442 domain-containing protein [Polyangiaceae bacterium]
MNIAATLQRALPSIEKNGNFIRDAWDRLRVVPGGSRIFSRMVGMAAPYTGSIGARVVELRQGFARVELSDRRQVRNHLDCVHAIALANLAELTGNVAVAYSLPEDARFIVKGMSLDYLKKARGTITGTASCPAFDDAREREVEIEVCLHDASGAEVTRAILRTLIGPKRG